MGSKRKILLSLTTTGENSKVSKWRERILEINRLKIEEIAFFPTCLKQKERRELYKRLENSSIRKIPHVHIRTDFEDWEMDYFLRRFRTEIFNIHPRPEALKWRETKYWKKIFLENLYYYPKPNSRDLFTKEAFKKYSIAGICLDLTHLASEKKIFPENYSKTVRLIKKHKIGCNHISGMGSKIYKEKRSGLMIYETHFLESLNQLEYLKRMPIEYFSNIVSIELENSFEQQLEAKKYIESIINSKK